MEYFCPGCQHWIPKVLWAMHQRMEGSLARLEQMELETA